MKKSAPLPPGPKPLPIVGNAFEINIEEPWLTYTEWGKKHGGIVYSRVFGIDFIIINNEKIARDLVDKRSKNYSDRPVISTNKLFGVDFNSALLPYGDKWRLHRRIFHQAFRADAVAVYRDMHLRKVQGLLVSLLDAPGEFESHVKSFAASIIMKATYGYDTAPRHDPFVDRVEELINIITVHISPERAAILGALPFLQRTPSWVPGAGFMRTAQRCRELAIEVKDAPFEYVKKAMAAGTAVQSMVSDSLIRTEGDVNSGEEELALKEAAATAFIGGAETTSSVILTFLLAMVLNPDIQKRAQADIDTVVGQGRLSTHDDRPLLPYIEAIYRETLRWHAVTPLSLPHAVTDDDIFEGHFIPKGAILILNVWAMTQDESIYPNPEQFKPERFLTVDGEPTPDWISPAFGFGRRICPGRFLAESSVWAAIVSVLATFDITKAKDSEGQEVEVKPEFTTGLAIHPRPFACSITPRSVDKDKLIRAADKND